MLVVIAGVAGGAVVDAQAPPSVSVPMSLILPNYDRVPIGQREAIEAGAFAARTNDAGSNWFNPAGLARARESSIELRAIALESGDVNDETRAIQADRQLGKTLNAVNALANAY